MDSPGVVFDDDDDDDAISQRQNGSTLLRNVVKVEEILSQTERAVIQKMYGLPDFSNTLEFLTMFANSGKLLIPPLKSDCDMQL
ncbi:hypothetical protein JVU11DRAFT_7148 [Chiua virens]|nr:hypothetical protein JVU11DRAFT_7148 [Chiua virens]